MNLFFLQAAKQGLTMTGGEEYLAWQLPLPWMVEMTVSIFSTELYVPPEAWTQPALAPPY